MCSSVDGYRIEVNLLAKRFRSGAHHYERVRSLTWASHAYHKVYGGKPGPTICCTVQVRQRLRDHTAPLDMLCIKILDGASVDLHYNALPGVSFSKHQSPSYAGETTQSVHAPQFASLVTHMQAGQSDPVPDPGASPSQVSLGKLAAA